MTDADEFLEMATELLASPAGVQMQWYKETRSGSGATGTVTVTADPNSPYSVQASPPKRVTRYDADGIPSAALEAIISGEQSFTPVIGDTVAIGGVRHRVLWVQQVYAGIGDSGENIIAAWRVEMEA